jgi:ribosomal-protein-alanine N-acetyltransferase
MSARITLRALTVRDKSSVIELLRDPDVMCFLGPRRALSQSEAMQWFDNELASSSRYVVASQKNNQLIGFCGIKIVAGISDFGYFFAKKFWGKGFASEACQLVIKKLAEDVDVSSLQVFIAKQNTASLGVAKKLNWLRLSKSMKDGEQGYYFQISK